MKKINFYKTIMNDSAFAEFFKLGHNGDKSYLDRSHINHEIMIQKFAGREMTYDPINKCGEVINNVARVTNEDRLFGYHLDEDGCVILDPSPNSKMNQQSSLTLNNHGWENSKAPTLAGCGFTTMTKTPWASLIKKIILYLKSTNEPSSITTSTESTENSEPNIISPNVSFQASLSVESPQVTRNMKTPNLIRALIMHSPLFSDERKSIENKLKNLKY